jgi:eukaryotic-like serine/threonine-protein kinase
VAQAMAYAHSKAVVHGAISPQTVFVTEGGAPKLMGFGWAQVANTSSLPELDPLVAGAAHYLAPEQLQGGTVDERTDVHALGALLFELLAGRPAFAGHTVPQVVQALLKHAPLAPHLGKPDVPHPLSEIAMRALQREPTDRYASVAAMVTALQDWLKSSARGAADASAGAAKPWRPWAVAAALLVTGSLVALTLTARSNGRAGPAPVPASQAVSTAAPAADTGVLADAKEVILAAKPAAAEAAAPAPAPAAVSALAAQLQVAQGAQVQPSANEPANPAANKPAAVPPNLPTKPPAKKPADSPADAKRRAAPPPAQAAAPAVPAAAAPLAKGVVKLAISPWGEVEVNGKPMGASPPLTQLVLNEGKHTITVRNGDAAPHTLTVQVSADQAATVRHRFGP